MKIFTILFVLMLSAAAYSQSQAGAAGPLATWPEVKAMQKEESGALRQKQDMEFARLLETQAKTFESTNYGDRMDLAKLFAQERAAAQKTYAEERDRLAHIQAEERKIFFPKP